MVTKNTEHELLAPANAILESISDGVFTIDMNWRVTFLTELPRILPE